jgi:hypothetical protein
MKVVSRLKGVYERQMKLWERIPQKVETHWYRITFIYCHDCKREDKIVERISGKKPKNPAKRVLAREANCCKL